MLTYNSIHRHLCKLDLDEYFESTATDYHEHGNYIRASFPDMDFDLVKERVLTKKYFYMNLDEDKTDMDTIVCKVYDVHQGFDVLCDFRVVREPVGCSLSVVVRVIEYYRPDGSYRPLLGFDDFEREMVKVKGGQ